MKVDLKDESYTIIITKITVYCVILLITILFIIFTPKKIITKDFAISLATSMAITDDMNLLLYDYDVYATDVRFREGLIKDVDEVKLSFNNRSEVLAIKVFGENKKIEIRNDYIYIIDPNTPELNIEYYLVKDMQFNDINLPCRTFIILLSEIALIVNTIYLIIYAIISISIVAPFSIKLIRLIPYLKRIN